MSPVCVCALCGKCFLVAEGAWVEVVASLTVCLTILLATDASLYC